MIIIIRNVVRQMLEAVFKSYVSHRKVSNSRPLSVCPGMIFSEQLNSLLQTRYVDALSQNGVSCEDWVPIFIKIKLTILERNPSLCSIA